jgi:hypothetical protein
MMKPHVQLTYEEPQLPAPSTNDVQQIEGLIQATAQAPTGRPRSFWEQFRIYAGQFWFYNTIANAWQTAGGGTAAGSDTQIQFNDSGALAADQNLAWIKDPGDGSNNYISIGEVPNVGSDQLRVGMVQGVPSVVFAQGTSGLAIEPYNTVTDTDYDGGDVDIVAADGGSDSGKGGEVYISGGLGSSADSDGAFATLRGGTDVGDGGSAYLAGGDTVSADANGGDVHLHGGAGNGAGHKGDVIINLALPVSTSADGGFLVVPTCAGTPTGAPTNNGSLVYDTTNDKLWIYNGSWKSATFT